MFAVLVCDEAVDDDVECFRADCWSNSSRDDRVAAEDARLLSFAAFLLLELKSALAIVMRLGLILWVWSGWRRWGVRVFRCVDCEQWESAVKRLIDMI